MSFSRQVLPRVWLVHDVWSILRPGWKSRRSGEGLRYRGRAPDQQPHKQHPPSGAGGEQHSQPAHQPPGDFASGAVRPGGLKLPITQQKLGGIVAPGLTLDMRMRKLTLGSLDDPPRSLGWRDAVHGMLCQLRLPDPPREPSQSSTQDMVFGRACDNRGCREGVDPYIGGHDRSSVSCTRALRLRRRCSVKAVEGIERRVFR